MLGSIRLLLLAGLVTVCACARVSTPVARAAPDLHVPFTKLQLGNGLTVILHEDHRIPRVSVNIWYHVGSGREARGRTGFAHLFEHIMFEGSAHVPEGAFDVWLESVGGTNNGSTTEDRTNYWIDVPSNALELALFLESDRMGFLLESMSAARVDGQRDVVKNERRQSYENRPYGMADLQLPEMLFPAGHPYSWPVIGSMEDLGAASYEDVAGFFRRFYGPGNASLVIAGDIEPATARRLVETWFGEIPAVPAPPAIKVEPVRLEGDAHRVLEDRVQLAKLVLAWPTVARFSKGDAALDALADVLTRGKSSRLHRSLVYEQQIAQSVDAAHASQKYGGYFAIEIIARPGHTLEKLRHAVDVELATLREAGITAQELTRTVNRIETDFRDDMERLSGFGGRADNLNAYYYYLADPDGFARDLARYQNLTRHDVQAVARQYLTRPRVAISVVPEGRRDLALQDARDPEGT